jgi:hypothetical protein
MKTTLSIIAITLLTPCLKNTPATAQSRMTIDLSQSPWNITLDPAATWKNDTLYLPPVDINHLPVNKPTQGWDALFLHPDTTGIHLPATVEQYLWAHNGQPFGTTGNYTGVSWFTTKTFIPREWEGKPTTMHIESLRFRAEIFINKKPVAYDLINSTPFDIDLTGQLIPGAENTIAFRITDPNGNFNWKDSQTYPWGIYLTNPSHGFGGITGTVTLHTFPNLLINEIIIRNNPRPEQIHITFTAENHSGTTIRHPRLQIEILEYTSGRRLYAVEQTIDSIPAGNLPITHAITLPGARLWSIEQPNLHLLRITLADDTVTERFGFRWFDIRNVNGDRQCFLNGKRIVLRSAISWGFWPDNGIAPTDELARKQIIAAKQLGLNMLNFHRAIGQTNVMNAADELGLLIWEEPGGNQYPANRFHDDDLQSRFYFAYRNEKLARMIRRDRNHPSLIIYTLHNERGAPPQAEDRRQMRLAQALDPSRQINYNSSNGENPEELPNDRFKLHLRPYDTAFYNTGWYDRHHAGGPGVYHDNLYRNPTDYYRHTTNKSEIVFWGEEGAIGTPPRLEKIRQTILQNGQTTGWEAADYLSWYDAYHRFLTEKGFHEAFPSVDHLTRAMGNVAYYYQGRIIENIRINNTVDGYAINGWESMKLENHSGIVDNYRNLKGDPELIARYNAPLFLSVKMNRKVMPAGDTTTVDVFIVNEENLQGTFTLTLTAKNEEGTLLASSSKKVRVTGGTTYGQLLREGWTFIPPTAGYFTLDAALTDSRQVVARGDDRLFAVKPSTEGIHGAGMVADTTGILAAFMRRAGFNPMPYTKGIPQGDYLVVGAFEPQQWGSGMSDLIEWVQAGGAMVIIDNPLRWAEFLADKEVLDFRGSKPLGRSWYGGNFFNRAHPLFDGLPVNVAFNWEYQCFSTYNRRRIGLRVENGETLVGCVSDHRKEVYSALSLIPVGMGKIIITTLDIPACMKNAVQDGLSKDPEGMNEAIDTFAAGVRNPADIVGQQLFFNLLKEATRPSHINTH